MGRPYRSELRRVPATIDWALREDVSALKKTLLQDLGQHNLVAIGSGGSMVAASYAALLHEAVTGRLARAATPLEAVTRVPPRGTGALLLSARGTNTDIRQVADVLPGLGYEVVSAVTARRRTPLSRILTKYRATTHEFQVPGGRDGFLATNSLIATLVLLYRAALLRNGSPDVDESALAGSPPIITGSQATLRNRTLVVLAHGWATPAAVDFESRFSESALANVSVTDPRNFAHGRHHWLSLHADDTGIVSLETRDGASEAKRMLRYIPADNDVLRITSTREGPAATIDLVRAVMTLAGDVAEARGIDPGQPSIADFGRRLFRSRTAPKTANPESMAIERKRRALILSPQSHQAVLAKALRSFLHCLQQTMFSGLAIDYDGTICDRNRRFDPLNRHISDELNGLLNQGMLLGVASGRGKSVHEQLRSALDPGHWSKVVVGLYNGAKVMSLDEDIRHSTNDVLPALAVAHAKMRSLEDVLGFESELRPYQVSLRPKTGPGPSDLRSVANDYLANIDGISIVASSHAVDIISSDTSKLAVVKALLQMRSGCILRIGDQGSTGGNDFELLNSGLSLSVDQVSSKLDTCWNLGTPGLVGPPLTLQYLKAIEVNGSEFHINAHHLLHSPDG